MGGRPPTRLICALLELRAALAGSLYWCRLDARLDYGAVQSRQRDVAVLLTGKKHAVVSYRIDVDLQVYCTYCSIDTLPKVKRKHN